RSIGRRRRCRTVRRQLDATPARRLKGKSESATTAAAPAIASATAHGCRSSSQRRRIRCTSGASTLELPRRRVTARHASISSVRQMCSMQERQPCLRRRWLPRCRPSYT
ncbi:unnamed protein product, partial [Phaeothamnion confervicola]